MDANHCLIVWRNEFARFEWPQIKRQSNVFSICLSPVRCPVRGFGGLTVQNYIVFETVLWFLEKNLFFYLL